MITTNKEPKDLVDLAHAHVTQHTNNGVKGEWKLRKNITSENLERFPSTVTDEFMFVILDFARKYELIALNAGIKHGKEITVKVYDELIKKYDHKLTLATKENERLATALDEHITRDTDGIN